MRVHVDKATRQILGFYPEHINYGDTLPPEGDLEVITDDKWRELLSSGSWGITRKGEPIQEAKTPK